MEMSWATEKKEKLFRQMRKNLIDESVNSITEIKSSDSFCDYPDASSYKRIEFIIQLFIVAWVVKTFLHLNTACWKKSHLLFYIGMDDLRRERI